MLLFFSAFTVSAEETAYKSTANEFTAALSKREPVIYVDDIDFDDSSAFITITYDVRIVGKKGGSTLKNAHFTIIGPISVNDVLTASFENIIFKGGFNRSEFDFKKEKYYGDIFGSERGKYRCFTVNHGYFDLSFSGCDFTEYSACRGSVITNQNDAKFSDADNSLKFTDCKFYKNTSQYGTAVLSGERLNTTLENCEFYDNDAMSIAGISIANGNADMTNVHIHDNNFYPFDYKEKTNLFDAGGGLYLGSVGGVFRDITVENNQCVKGGGLGIVTSQSGNKEITFINLILKNNKSLLNGGGMYIESMTGQPIKFFNCLFEGNSTAGNGSVIYATPLAAFMGKYSAGLIDFTLCTFKGNTAADDKTFEFYEMKNPEVQKGKISHKGCIIGDKTTIALQNRERNEYNLIGEASPSAEKLSVPKKVFIDWTKEYGNVGKAPLTTGYNKTLALNMQNTSKALNNTGISATVPILYGLCLTVSAVLLILYIFIVKEKHIQMLLMLISVCIINAGYLALSLSGNLTEALLANRIAYLGNSFQPILLLLTIANVCRYKPHKYTKLILTGISVLMFVVSLSVGYSELFYKSVSYELIDGVVTLTKTYGILHTVYSVYVITYFLMCTILAIYSVLKKKLVFYRYVVFVLLLGFINITVWLVERFININYEFLSISYITTNILLIILYAEMSENGLFDSFQTVLKESADNPAVIEPDASEDLDTATHELIRKKAEINDEEKLRRLCEINTTDNKLSSREIEILILLIKGFGRREIAEKLFITENTVKTHTRNIYTKIGVANRTELQEKIFTWIE